MSIIVNSCIVSDVNVCNIAAPLFIPGTTCEGEVAEWCAVLILCVMFSCVNTEHLRSTTVYL